MPTPRWIPLWFPAGVAALALVFLGSGASTAEVAGCFHGLAVGSLAVATLVSMARGPRRDERWLGYAVFGWTCYVALFVRDATEAESPHNEFAAELATCLGFLPVLDSRVMEANFAAYQILRRSLVFAYAGCGAALAPLLRRGEGTTPGRRSVPLRLLAFGAALAAISAGVWANAGRVAGYFDEVAVGSLAVASLGAILRGRRGAGWVGYAVFGWSYYVALFVRDGTWFELFPDLEVTALLERLGRAPDYDAGEDRYAFPAYRVVRWSLLIAFAWLGTLTGRVIAAHEEVASETEHSKSGVTAHL